MERSETANPLFSGYLFGYLIDFFDVQGLENTFTVSDSTDQVFGSGLRVSENTLRKSKQVFSKTEGFPSLWRPRRYFQKRFQTSETFPETFKGFRRGFRLGLGFLGNGFFLEYVHYSYELSNSKCQVFLVQVLTGESIDYKDQHDRSLRRPPKKNEKVSEARYNSVTGET
jgi:hypothetical protein